MIRNSNVETIMNMIFPSGLDINEFIQGYEKMNLFINNEKYADKL